MSIVDVIEFGGSADDLVWRYPAKDFSTLSQLIVNESHEALLYRDGKAYDLLGAGCHTLSTANIPLFSKFFKLQAGEKLPFQCEIYFVNKTEKMAISWGTRTMNYLDPNYNNYAFPINAYGKMSLNVLDSRRLIVKLVGQQSRMDIETIRNYFKPSIITQICSTLPRYLRENAIPVERVDEHLVEIAKVLSNRVAEEMQDYGISLEKFWLEEIVKPENDPVYREINRQKGTQVTMITQGSLDIQRANLQAQEALIRQKTKIQMDQMEVDLQAYTNQALGITEKDRMKTEVLLHVADNPGGGNMVQNAVLGASVGMATAGFVNQAIGSYARDVFSEETMAYGTNINNNPLESMPSPIQLKSEISHDSSEDDDAVRKKVRNLRIAWEEGLFTDEEYKARREELLNID